MKTITIHDAKTNLSKYIAAAKSGEKVYIGGFGKAEVVLSKITDSDENAGRQRDYAKAKGKITEYADSFSETTEKEVSDLMFGN